MQSGARERVVHENEWCTSRSGARDCCTSRSGARDCCTSMSGAQDGCMRVHSSAQVVHEITERFTSTEWCMRTSGARVGVVHQIGA